MKLQKTSLACCVLAFAAALILVAARSSAASDPQSAASVPPAPAASSSAAAAAPFHFVDVAASAGIDLVNESGDPRKWYIPESNGCGAAWLDYDRDGDMDLFVANGAGMRLENDGARLEVVRGKGSRLYRNDGAMKFVDVTEAAGAHRTEWINAVAVADPDNDGDPDLYLACFDPDVYLRNDAGRFVDATREAGLGSELWGAGAAFGDVDNDGALDLYVANYCLFDLANPPAGGKRNVIEGVEVGWGPEAENKKGYNLGAPDRFYRGDGKGHFREATREAGLQLERGLCSYAVVFSDVNGDGRQDILVANDLQPANLFMNRGKGTFVDEGGPRGFALNFEGKPTSAMGLSVEDFDADGDFDVLRTNFDFEANSLHVNDGEGYFVDAGQETGLATPSLDKLGWGGGFFDADCDGDFDILVANGHVYPQSKEIGMSAPLMPTQLFEARRAGSTLGATTLPSGAPASGGAGALDTSSTASGGVYYVEVTADAGPGLSGLHSARGVAFGDPDNDGDIDAFIVDLDALPRLLENRTPRRGHFLSIRLVGSASNRDGIGAVVRVRTPEGTFVREARTSQGLYSSHDPRLHFGLGSATRVEAIEVTWPSGRVTVVENPPVDTFPSVAEPAS